LSELKGDIIILEMSLPPILSQIANSFEIDDAEVYRLFHADIETAISSFREEIRLARNVETLEFILREKWTPLFSEKGVYYETCKRSSILKTLRFNAYARYQELLTRKKRNEQQQIKYVMVESHKVLNSVIEADVVEVDGELCANEITYSS
jgi:hypothetical protein